MCATLGTPDFMWVMVRKHQNTKHVEGLGSDEEGREDHLDLGLGR